MILVRIIPGFSLCLTVSILHIIPVRISVSLSGLCPNMVV